MKRQTTTRNLNESAGNSQKLTYDEILVVDKGKIKSPKDVVKVTDLGVPGSYWKESAKRKLVKEGAGAGYTVKIKDLKFGKIVDYKVEKGEKSWEDSYKVKVEIEPGDYEIAANDYYNDYFWQEHEFGDTPTAQIDGGYAIFDIALDGNPDEDDEALFQMNRELENRKLDISFDYGWGWTHANLPSEEIEADHVDIDGRDVYFGIDKLVLNAPDLADAVNSGYQSTFDQGEEDEEEEEPVDDLTNESYDDRWMAVGAGFDEFRQRLWNHARKDVKNRKDAFSQCMNKCEEALKEYQDTVMTDEGPHSSTRMF